WGVLGVWGGGGGVGVPARQPIEPLGGKTATPVRGVPAETPRSGMQSIRLGCNVPRSGSTANRLFVPSVMAHTTVPRAAATAVGVEIAKFDWRILTSAIEACAIVARTLPTARWRSTVRLWFC